MGLEMNIVLLMLCISFMFYLGGYPNNFSTIACSVGVQNYMPFTCPSGIGNLYAVVYGLLILLVGGTIVASFIFPNPYTLFAPWALFLLGFFAFPIGIFNELGPNGLPGEVVAFITVFYSTAYIFAVMRFASGRG